MNNKVVIILICFCVSVNGQNDEHILQKATSYFNEVNAHSLKSYTPELIHTPTIFTQEYYKMPASKIVLLQNKALAANRTIGVSLISSARYSGAGIAVEDLDFDKNISLNAQLGLNWDIVNNGFIKQKIEAEKYATQAALLGIEEANNYAQLQYASRYQQIIFSFNELLIAELESHLSLYEKQLALYYQLYYQNKIPYTKILVLKKAMRAIETRLCQTKNYNASLNYTRGLGKDLGIFELNLEAIMGHYKANINRDETEKLNNKLVDLSYQSKKETSLSVYASYQYTANQNFSSPSISPVVGFRFKMPFKINNNRDHLIALEKAILKEKIDFEEENTSKEIVNNYYEFTYKLKQFKDLHHNFLMAKEQLLSASIANKNVIATTISSFSITNEILTLRREMIDVNRQMYLLALKVFTLAGLTQTKDVFQFVSTINLSDEKESFSVVMNTGTTIEDIAFKIQYLKRKRIQSVILTGDKNLIYQQTRLALEAEEIQVQTVFPAMYTELHVSDYTTKEQLMNTAFAKNGNVVLNDLEALIGLEMKALKE